MNRGEFIKRELHELFRTVCTGLIEEVEPKLELVQEAAEKATSEPHEEEEEETGPAAYFQSFVSCYPLLAESPMELLQATARQLGIETENKSKIELAREIFGRNPS